MNASQLVAIEFEVLKAILPPLTIALIGWIGKLQLGVLRDARVRSFVARVVAWADQTVPNKSQRYVEAASLISKRFPGLSSTDVELLIESEVHALKVASASLAAKPVQVQPATPAQTAQRGPAPAGEVMG